jgi:hypothetical protein
MDRLPPGRSPWTLKNPNLQGCDCAPLDGIFILGRLGSFSLSWIWLTLSIYLMLQVYVDGTTTMSTHERKASIREFYGNFPEFSILGIFGFIVVTLCS